MPIDNERFTICREKWEEMTPAERGRICAKCSKEIVDFTQMSLVQIERTLKRAPGTCGLYKTTQFRNPAPLIAATAAAALALGGGAAIIPSSAEAQTTSASRSPAALATPIRVHGVVMDSASGTPLRGAQVMAGRVGNITNDRGEFEFRITTEYPRPLRITAQLIGYQSKTFEIQRPDSVIELKYDLAQHVVGIVELVVTGLVRVTDPQRATAAVAPLPLQSRIIRSIRRILP